MFIHSFSLHIFGDNTTRNAHKNCIFCKVTGLILLPVKIDEEAFRGLMISVSVQFKLN